MIPETSEHRIVVWADSREVIHGSLYAIARDDDVTFGILNSSFHDAWATRQGNRLGVGNQRRYNLTRTFQTFPFPEGLTPNIPAVDYANDPRAISIAREAERFHEIRTAWLNPRDLVRVEAEVVPGYPDRVLPRNAEAAAELHKRTLTKLYNDPPEWLADVHATLDRAVAAAYGWREDLPAEDALQRLLELNLERAETRDEVANETALESMDAKSETPQP